jgi:hypothetical protein
MTCKESINNGQSHATIAIKEILEFRYIMLNITTTIESIL